MVGSHSGSRGQREQDEADPGAVVSGGGGLERRWGSAGRSTAWEETTHGLRHRAVAQVPDLVSAVRRPVALPAASRP